MSESLIENTSQELAGIKYLLQERNKSVLEDIIWDSKEVINRALNQFGDSIAFHAVFANIDSDVTELKAEKATLYTLLNNLTTPPPPPQPPTGKPKLYFDSMFELYYDCSYAFANYLISCSLSVLSLFHQTNNVFIFMDILQYSIKNSFEKVFSNSS